ncbi:MAG: hypothetical protein DMG32_11530 [Acidobacteria bacterium]|nr:MAG: hypothetical protein DMG32_11530 [Acidobacteriota bacterium]
MKRNFLVFFALGIGVSILSLPLSAHHGNAAYDTEKKITLKGTVTQWFWANPHCVLQFDATDDSGQLVHWGAETENPTTMTHSGWTKTSFKPGDEVTVTMITVKNGKPIGRIVDVVLPNGQKLAGRVIPQLPSYNPEDPPKQ